MCFFKRLKEKRTAKAAEINRRCDELIAQLTAAIIEAKSYTADKNEYVDKALASAWCEKHKAIIVSFDAALVKKLKKADRSSELLTLLSEANGISFSLALNIDRHNETVAESRIEEAYSLIGEVEGRKLDRQQMLAITKDAHNHLIIAGAGTGKTTTVVGKIKYLLKSGRCEPKDILVLSFTNASAEEMSKRINDETGCKIAASTFHKLGIDIITKADGIKPKITQIDLRKFISDELGKLMSRVDYMAELTNYLVFNKVVFKSEFDFKSESEYREYLKANPPVTMLGESVKSYGEADIANFLYQNSIRYEYEAEYHVDTRTAEYGQYHPDFYLPDYNIYIEYFGINREGHVPEWFSSKRGLNPSETYRQSMEWKRRLHCENGTTLLECYSYEKLEGILLKSLEKKLKEHDVKLSPKTPNEIWSSLTNEDNDVLSGIKELFGTVINLIKSNNYTVATLRSLVKNNKYSFRYNSLLNLIEPIFNSYELALKKSGEIDFNDMINVAAEYVREGKYKNPFKYVIVDEYQDISKARYLLLHALRESQDYDLFCVGDDWQSIYRFAGSDINYILNFEKYWGATTISKIETTYRFTRSLIEISGSFIMQNPMQIAKNLRGSSTDMRFSLGEISAFNEQYAIEFMTDRLNDLPTASSVFFIGRYSFDASLLKNNSIFDCNYDNVNDALNVKYKKRPDLEMRFLTAHKSKGLQADYVFIINNKNTRMGFPSKIQDDPILDFLLESAEGFPFAEERRLFYVALTRAKTKAFLLTVKDNESVFVNKLKSKYAQQLKNEQYECPLCGGRLVRKNGRRGEFIGCENYRSTGCRYTRDLHSKR